MALRMMEKGFSKERGGFIENSKSDRSHSELRSDDEPEHRGLHGTLSHLVPPLIRVFDHITMYDSPNGVSVRA